jgi:hypothetical protein
MTDLETSVAQLATGFYRFRKDWLKEALNYEKKTWADLAGEILADRTTQWLKNLTDEELAGVMSGTIDVKAALAQVAKRLNA